ncbi:MAG TPA: FkbM family methyltransferase [Chloroflexota bacterium]|jgi:FkbM family methyltransferase
MFRFPFGQIHYVDAVSLSQQYDDIFVGRGYEVLGLDGAVRIMDCGGNIGLSAIWFKRRYPGATIVVFEADPTIARVLEQNLHRCGIQQVTVVQAAVGAHAGTASFLPNNSDGGYVVTGSGLAVPAVRLVDMLDGPIDILKIDIEGSEFSLLMDLCYSGRASLVKHIICEIHGGTNVQKQFGEVWDALTQAGFCIAVRSATSVPEGVQGTGSDPTPFSGLASAGFQLNLYAWRPSRE